MGEWIAWEGGECPVDGDTPVVIWMRADSHEGLENRKPVLARHWYWGHSQSYVAKGCDIIAYRIIDNA